MSWKLSLGTALSALALASAVQAQSVLFNIRVGPTFASRETNQPAFESRGRMSWGGGGGFRFGSGPITIDPSVMIVGKVTATGDVETTGENRLKLQYIEFPVLATFTVLRSHKFRPFIEGGPVLSLETRCRVEFALKNSKDEVGCDIDTSQTDDRHKVDFGVVGGGGIDFGLPDGRHFSLEARYTHGFSNISAAEDASLVIRNRAVSFYFAYYFPFKPDM